MDGAPGREDGDHPEKRREHDEQQADAVKSEMIFRADGGNPIGGFLKRETAPLRLETANERKRDQETAHPKNISSALMRQLGFAGDEENQTGAFDGREQGDAQEVMGHKV